jgi:phage recombination protein Bet
MNQLTTQTKNGFLETMASKSGMDPNKFKSTVIATAFSRAKDGRAPTDEEFATFMLIAQKYDLNPLTKEIYGFQGQGGKVQTVVSIDGWMNLINSHPQFDGMEFEDIPGETKSGATVLKAIKCTIYRKDRAHPINVIEYFDECKRPTDTWDKWPRRMLRHKAAIQCARYAFGFAGIIDPDEAERGMKDITPEKTTPRAAAILADKIDDVETGFDPASPEGDETVEWGYNQETGEIFEDGIIETPVPVQATKSVKYDLI